MLHCKTLKNSSLPGGRGTGGGNPPRTKDWDQRSAQFVRRGHSMRYPPPPPAPTIQVEEEMPPVPKANKFTSFARRSKSAIDVFRKKQESVEKPAIQSRGRKFFKRCSPCLGRSDDADSPSTNQKSSNDKSATKTGTISIYSNSVGANRTAIEMRTFPAQTSRNQKQLKIAESGGYMFALKVQYNFS